MIYRDFERKQAARFNFMPRFLDKARTVAPNCKNEHRLEDGFRKITFLKTENPNINSQFNSSTNLIISRYKLQFTKQGDIMVSLAQFLKPTYSISF